jgi:hypothetical protein
MHSILLAAFDAVHAALDAVATFDSNALRTAERFELLERCEQVRRRLPSVEHPVINKIASEASPAELEGKLSYALAERLLIGRAEAARRIHEADDLGSRTALTGTPLPAALPATAAAQQAGRLGAGQIAVIRRFCEQLPSWVDEARVRTPKRNLPTWAPNSGPNSCAGSPTSWRTASTLTATTATTIVRADVAWR